MSTEQIVERFALNFTDLTGAKTGCTTLGSNKFWTGEVVRRADGLYDFRCRWGSTGTPGSDKGSKYGISESAALSTLRSKVKSKEKKGYTKLDTRSKDEEVAKAASQGIDLTNGGAKIQPKVVAPTGPSLHPKVERLLSVIYGSNSNVVRSGLSAQAGATEDNPIGNLSDAQLDLGGGILDDIETLLKSEIGRETRFNRNTEIPLRHDGTPIPRVLDLTNQFMSNVPREIARSQRGRANLHRVVISSWERLEEQRKFLQLLRDAHLSQGTFQAASRASAPASKAHVWYDGLGCDIEFCDPGSKEHDWVVNVFSKGQSRRNANWFSGSSSRLRVANVWKFTRKGSDVGFQRYAKEATSKSGAVGNIWAWHGTRTENLLGIGKSGLLMPENLPRGVHISGKAFGRGVYHAPNWTATGTSKVGRFSTDGTNGALKSMNYTSARGAYYGSGNTSSGAFMFLQEVALGVPEVLTRASWDQHRPKGWPKNDWIYACAGGIRSLTHDEVVTFSEDAQVFRYIVEILTN